MILKLEETDDFEERINLVRNIESMIRHPRPMIQLFLLRMNIFKIVANILLGESMSRTDRTDQLSFLKEELEIASFDFIGELIKGNKLCMTIFEIQLGQKQIMKIIDKGMKNVVNSNLFFRSVMISIIYFFD
jgi:Protein of unknown function (DUF3689)